MQKKIISAVLVSMLSTTCFAELTPNNSPDSNISVLDSEIFQSNSRGPINPDPKTIVENVKDVIEYRVNPKDVRTWATCGLGLIMATYGLHNITKAFNALHEKNNQKKTKSPTSLSQKCINTCKNLLSNSVALTQLGVGSVLTTIGGSFLVLNDEVLSALCLWGQKKVHDYKNAD